MEKLELRFTYEKETKNTIRYQEELGEEAYSDKDIAVGTVYIQKQALGEPVPRRLKVDIWAEYARLKSLGWIQQRIAKAKGVDRSTVAQRLKFHQVSDKVKGFVTSGLLSEFHLREITGLLPGNNLSPWLTTEQVWGELGERNTDLHPVSRERLLPEGGRPKPFHHERVLLRDLGLTEIQSHRWQLDRRGSGSGGGDTPNGR